MRLILFDIDGTLITARGAGRRAVKRALEAVFGTTGSLDTYEMSGKTDPRIIHDLMEAGGVDRALVKARLDEFFEAYAVSLAEEIGDGRDVVTMPGVADLVRRLDAAEGVVLGLLTGNIEAGRAHQARPHGPLALLRPRRVRLRRSRSPPAPVAGGAPGARAPRPPVPRGGSDGDRRHAPRRRLRAPLRRRRGGGGHRPLHRAPSSRASAPTSSSTTSRTSSTPARTLLEPPIARARRAAAGKGRLVGNAARRPDRSP